MLRLQERRRPGRRLDPLVILEHSGQLLSQSYFRLSVEPAMPVQLELVRHVERRQRAVFGVSDAKRVATANGNVATNCVSMTMNGTLRTFDVYVATFRRSLRRSMNRSRTS
jgi:hypothetical protein